MLNKIVLHITAGTFKRSLSNFLKKLVKNLKNVNVVFSSSKYEKIIFKFIFCKCDFLYVYNHKLKKIIAF